MALADYRLCDLCEGKAFYDAHMHYQYPNRDGSWEDDYGSPIRGENYKLGYLGDWKVLCVDCAKTHKCVIQPLEKETEK